MSMSAVKKPKPGVNFFKFSEIISWAPFAASIATSILSRAIDLGFSIIIGAALLPALYMLLLHLSLRRWRRTGFIKLKGYTAQGTPIYIVDDDLANALAMGIWKKSCIVITSGLISILNEDELKAVLEHEQNHVNLMHPLICLLNFMIFLLVAMSVVLLTYIPYLSVVNFIILFLVGNLFLMTLLRGLEKMADRVSNPDDLHNALIKIKMDLHEEGLSKKGPLKKSSSPLSKFLRGILSTHPLIEERHGRAEPSLVKQAGVLGAYVFFLVAFNLGVKIIDVLGLTGHIVIFVIGSILSTSIVGAGLIALDYLFMSSLIQMLSRAFKFESPEPVNVLNGLTSFLALTAIPTISGITCPLITWAFTIIALITTILLTTLGWKPLRKALCISAIAWIVHTMIFLAAFSMLVGLAMLRF